MRIAEQELHDKIRLLNPVERLVYLLNCAIKQEDLNGGYFSFILGNEVSEVLHLIRNRYSIDKYDFKISNNESIININEDLLTISPMLFGFDIWKDIITYEFSLIKPSTFGYEVTKFKSCIEDLRFRLNYNFIIDIHDLLLNEWWPDDIPEGANKQSYIGNLDKDVFDVSINDYVSFLEQLRPNETFNNDNLREKLERLETLLNAKNTDRLILNGKYKQSDVVNLFKYFQRKWNSKIISEDFVSCKTCFNTVAPKEFYLSSEDNNFYEKMNLDKEELEDFIGFLRFLKTNQIIRDSDRNIAKVILSCLKSPAILGFESIKKRMSNKDGIDLPEEIRRELQYKILYLNNN